MKDKWRNIGGSKLQLGSEKLGYSGKFIQIIERQFRNKTTGKCGMWEVVKRTHQTSIVAVAPVTRDGKVVLEKIFRVPMKSWIIELCAGAMSPEDKNEEMAVRRELSEETGYSVGSLRLAMRGPFNCGAQQDQISVYVGYDAEKTHEANPEGEEDIETIEVPVRKLKHFLEHPPAGTLVDVKTFGIIPFLDPKHWKK